MGIKKRIMRVAKSTAKNATKMCRRHPGAAMIVGAVALREGSVLAMPLMVGGVGLEVAEYADRKEKKEKKKGNDSEI